MPKLIIYTIATYFRPHIFVHILVIAIAKKHKNTYLYHLKTEYMITGKIKSGIDSVWDTFLTDEIPIKRQINKSIAETEKFKGQIFE